MTKIYKGLLFLIIKFVLRKTFFVAKSIFQDARFRCFVGDVVGRHLFKYGVHEEENSRFLLDNLKLKKFEIGLDIGANLGWYTVLISKNSHEQATLYAFEPDSDNFSLLQHNIKLNECSNVQTFKQAVSNKSENLNLYKYPKKNCGKHSLLPQKDCQEVEVAAITLNDFFKDKNLEKIRFIKIDIEGYELTALKGASSLLAHCPMIMMEFSPNLFQNEGESSELLDFMKSYSYTPKVLKDGCLVEVDMKILKISKEQIDLFWTK